MIRFRCYCDRKAIIMSSTNPPTCMHVLLAAANIIQRRSFADFRCYHDADSLTLHLGKMALSMLGLLRVAWLGIIVIYVCVVRIICSIANYFHCY